MNRSLCLVVITIGLAMAFAPRGALAGADDPADDEGYIINFDHRETRARTATIEIVCAQLTTWRRAWDDAKPFVEQDPLGYRLLADVQTGPPDKDGRSSTITYTVRAFTETKGSADRELLSPGAKVFIGKAGDDSRRITVDGKKPSDQIRRALALVLRQDQDRGDRGGSDGFKEVFGSPILRRRPGQTWKIDRRAAIDAYGAGGLVIDPDDVSGHGSLLGVETIDGVRCLKVETALDVDRFLYPSAPATQPASQRSRQRASTQPAAASAPSMAGWDSGAMSWRTIWLIPLDPDAISPGGTTSSTLTYRMHGEDNGRGYSNEHTVQREYNYRLVPPGELADTPAPTPTSAPAPASQPATRPASQRASKASGD